METKYKEQHSSKDKRMAMLTFIDVWHMWPLPSDKGSLSLIPWSIIKRQKQHLMELL